MRKISGTDNVSGTFWFLRAFSSHHFFGVGTSFLYQKCAPPCIMATFCTKKRSQTQTGKHAQKRLQGIFSGSLRPEKRVGTRKRRPNAPKCLQTGKPAKNASRGVLVAHSDRENELVRGSAAQMHPSASKPGSPPKTPSGDF